MDRKPIFTVDFETWFNGIMPYNYRTWHNMERRVAEPTFFLLDILNKYGVKAIFFMVEWLKDYERNLVFEIESAGHIIGKHGKYHAHNELESGLFRSPYWDTTPMPFPPSGGFFFRAMPLAYVKWAVKQSGVFWIHPHDPDVGHPELADRWLNLKRHIGLKEARTKLDDLLKEVEFDNAKEYFYASYV